ncbi:MAG TPA: BrnT family toxin [Desulfuromonadales bacterium]|nr:BrnT family toxin [Desulfuromonadales bacterium]
MKIEFDPLKRDKTLLERGLDFAEAPLLFSGLHFTAAAERVDYGESRFITVGTLHGRVVVLVWTPRAIFRRIISMRYAHEREISRYRQHLG